MNRTGERKASSRAKVEELIDRDNAEMRALFLAQFEMLDSATVALLGDGTELLAIPGDDGQLYPAFQFDREGRPWPLLAAVLAAIPPDRSPWQRAFWMVAPNERLQEETPIARIERGDPQVVEAARHMGELPIG